jgi:hypothetical protein
MLPLRRGAQQFTLDGFYRRKRAKPVLVEVHMTGSAAATSAAQRQEFPEVSIANVLHDASICLAIDRLLGTFPGDYGQRWHSSNLR